MCRKCSDCKVFVSKSDLNFFKYNFLILVLFSITCSALGLSCYALFRVQNLSDDLNLLKMVLKENRVKSVLNSEFNSNIKWRSEHGRSFEGAPVTGRIVERAERSISSDKSESHEDTTVQSEEDITTSESAAPAFLPFDSAHRISKKAAHYELNSDAEVFTPEYPNIYKRRNRGRNDNELEIINEYSPQAGRLKSLTAIHLSGDTSRYVYGQHSNFKGNGHLRHPQRTFVDWKSSDWVDSIGADNHFNLNNGIITVRESGLYFMYGQIYYLDEHDMNGFRMYKNSDTVLQCTVTSHSSERMLKGNTCYTAGVTYLDLNDTISVGDITDGRYSLFEPGKSFFGLIKLGDVRMK